MKTQLFIFLFLAGILLIWSCESNNPCPGTVDKGELFYTQKSLETLPYVGNSTVIFKDYLCQELAFSVTDLGDTIKSGLFAGTCNTNPGQRVYFSYQKKNRTIQLQNDSVHSTFYIWIDTELSFDSYSEYDKIKVSYRWDDSDGYQYFHMMVDERSVSAEEAEKINSLVIYEPESEILGRKYADTYHMKNPDPYNTHLLYYNFQSGVVFFKDDTGKTWVFDRFE